MTLSNLEFGTVCKPADVAAPAAQNSTAVNTVVAGSELDARVFGSAAYTMRNTGAESIDYQVLGALAADFSDEVAVASATILAGGLASYSAVPPPFSYYRVKVADTVGGNHGQMTLLGAAK